MKSSNPTAIVKNSELNNAQVLDIVKEFPMEDSIDKRVDNLRKGIKVVECTWGEKKCLFLISKADQIESLEMKARI